MTKEMLAKLVAGIKILVEKTGTIPPVLVRPHPTKGEGWYEIIDGFHRRTGFVELGIPKLPCKIFDVDDATAKRMTISMNYVRGTADPDDYAKLVKDIVDSIGVDETLPFLADSASSLEEILKSAEMEIPDDLLAAVKEEYDVEEVKERKKAAEGPAGKPALLKFHATVLEAKAIEDALAKMGAQKGEEGSALATICREWLAKRR